MGFGAPAGIRTRVFGFLPVQRRKAEILDPTRFNLAIFGRRGVISLLLPEPKPEHHAIVPFLGGRNQCTALSHPHSTTVSMAAVKKLLRTRHTFGRRYIGRAMDLMNQDILTRLSLLSIKLSKHALAGRRQSQRPTMTRQLHTT